MKRLSIVTLFTVILMSTACNQKQGLAGSEYGTDNILSVQADSLSASLNRQVDSLKTSSRLQLIAELEEEARRQLTEDELSQLDSELTTQFEAQRSNVYHMVDSVRRLGTIEVTLLFKDDQTLEWQAVTKGAIGDTTEVDEARYMVDGRQIVAEFGEDGKDTLLLSEDGSEIVGALRSTYKYTIKKRK
jgi:hypothetical protein